MMQEDPPANELGSAGTVPFHSTPDKSIKMESNEQSRDEHISSIVSARKEDRLHEADFHAQMGDPYLEGPLKSTKTPEEEAAFHERIDHLRAKALASKAGGKSSSVS